MGELNTVLSPAMFPLTVKGKGKILHNGLAKALCFSCKIVFSKYTKKDTMAKPTKNSNPFTMVLFTMDNITIKKVKKNGDINVVYVNKLVNVNVIAAAFLAGLILSGVSGIFYLL